ncbi:MAG TPA: arylamine N-acetyltransferase [Edaphocola sp.]|nr:arylamine N-acetyltransferase [Edaphocola sp.]
MTQEYLEKYLGQIQFSGVAHPDLKTLKTLQEKHLNHFPFENINTFLHQEVVLDAEHLCQKFIFQQRGGYCFEQNLFFMDVLTTIGFEVRPLLGRVTVPFGRLGRTHQLLLITIQNTQYIVDVGFGGMVYPQPLLLKADIIQETALNDYRLRLEENTYHVEILLNEEWNSIYTFDCSEYIFPDIIIANWYISTHPASHFTKELMISRIKGTTRYNLRNNQLSIYQK